MQIKSLQATISEQEEEEYSQFGSRFLIDCKNGLEIMVVMIDGGQNAREIPLTVMPIKS